MATGKRGHRPRRGATQPARAPEAIAWILPPAGGRGAFQAGAVKALDEAGLYPDLIVASGAGAITACLYATAGAAAVDDYWLHRGRGRFPTFSIRHNPLVGHSLFPPTRLLRAVEPLIDFELLCASQIELALGLLNLTTGEAEVQGNRTTDSPHTFREYARAAYSIPLVYPPRRIEDNLYTMNPLAGRALLEHALARGATDVFYVHAFSAASVSADELRAFRTVAGRVHQVLGGYVTQRDLAASDVAALESRGVRVTPIAPRRELSQLVRRTLFAGDSAREKWLDAGFKDARTALQRHRRRRLQTVVPLPATREA